ncbi:MAG: hypothetical protein IJ520_02315, partial [Synergistaceae bacterium]|nr:hypothetical protein [Synergistaceae bacterium]
MANENLYTNLEQLELLAQRTKDAIPVNVSDLENDSGYQTAAQVEAAINAKVSSVFDYKGSIAFAELLPALLIADNVGDVYNISDAFT